MKIVTVPPPAPQLVHKAEFSFSVTIPTVKQIVLAVVFLGLAGYVVTDQIGVNPIHWIWHPTPGPTPPGPVPPAPEPPGPTPSASKVARVLVLTDVRGVKPTKGQQGTLGGLALWQKLDAVCPTEGVGKAWSTAAQSSGDPSKRAWRYFDKDTDVSGESAAWQQAATQAKALLAAKNVAYPAIVIFTNGEPIAATVPETDDAALSLFDHLEPGG